jgi:hypothetical protein
VRASVAYVLPHRPRKELRVLQNDAEGAARTPPLTS